MAKEFPEERLIVERLWQTFQKDWLTTSEIAKFDGCSPKTAHRRYKITGGGISINCLAHMKCQLARK